LIFDDDFLLSLYLSLSVQGFEGSHDETRAEGNRPPPPQEEEEKGHDL
jgi:hypothetical protein